MDTATVDTTPATTTDSAPAAPATSAPETTVATSERPTNASSLAQWMETHAQDAPPDPAVTDPATTVQAAPGDPTNTTEKKGPIPFDVHKKTLDNAYQERDSARTDLKQAHEVLTKFGPTAQRMSSDPIGFLNDFAKQLASHPIYGPQMRSAAARTLATRTTTAAEPQPDVEIVDGNGQVTGRTFSAKGLAARDAWQKQQLLAEIRQEYGPLKAEREQRVKDEQSAAMVKQIEAKADEVMADVMDILDGDKAHLGAVDQTMQANPTWSAHKAALHVRKTVIVPGLEGKATLKAVDTFNKKAAGNTANGAGSAATPAKPRDAKSLAKWMEANAR